STITDYDVWADYPVSSKDIVETLNKNVETTKKVLSQLIPLIPKVRDTCNCKFALDEALI
ncbi:MAG: S-methyl-5'-thioadenosine phosphorylase, partial [Candidatus Nitrosocosmicus sp.]